MDVVLEMTEGAFEEVLKWMELVLLSRVGLGQVW